MMVDVLAVLMGSAEGVDGLTVADQAKRLRPTVYATLVQLEDCGWVESEWETALLGREARSRLYRLTPGGRSAAAQVIADAQVAELHKRRRSWLRPAPALRALPALFRGVR